VLGSAGMEAAQALADLTEISSQIESAVLAGADGAVLASTYEDDERAKSVAEAALELLREAEATSPASGESLVQLEAATPEGCVFVVRDANNVVAAITGAEPTVGLVFYDLKTCLRLVGEKPPPPDKEKPAPRRRKKADEPKEAGDGEG
jgi:predicted regulator of Ras-like GTPase activity (Roadblock/LC7/MglB family)